MAIYKPKVKKTTSTLDEVKFPSSVIDGLDKIAVRYVGDTSKLKTTGVYSVALERDGNDIKSSSYDNYDDVDSILIVGKNNDGDYFQMMFFDGKVYYRKTGENSNFPYYWSEGISLLEGGGSGGGTTYTFASGTTNGAFTVTPSGGSAQTVYIHGLGTAAYKNYTDTVSSSADLVTSKAVNSAISGFVSRYATNEDIAGTKNFTGLLRYDGVNVAKEALYYQLGAPYKITSTSSGTTTVNLSSIIPNFVSGYTYQIYGQVFAYHTTTAKVYLWSDLWGSDNNTNYYIINTTSNSRCGSTAFTIPAVQYLKINKNINISEFTFMIYGYRMVR